MTQQATLAKAAPILASVGLLSVAATAQNGSSLSPDRLDRVANMPGIGGAAAGLWYAPVDFEGELRGVLFNDQMEPEYEVEALMTQIIAFGVQQVPSHPAELMEGYLYGDVYRVATDQAPRELVGRLEGSWQGNQHGAGQFFALMYHLRMTQEVAGILEGEFRGAYAVDNTLIHSTSDDRSFGAPPPVQVGNFIAQQLPGGLAGVGFGQPGLPPVDDDCSDVTACIDKHRHARSRRTAREKSFDETGAPLTRAAGLSQVPDDSSSGDRIRGQRGVGLREVPQALPASGPVPPALGIGGLGAAGASLVPERAQPGRFHGRWKLFL